MLTGSISLAHELLRLSVVDELRMFVYPVVLGQGRGLFTHGDETRDFTLAETRAFSAGVVLLRYTR